MNGAHSWAGRTFFLPVLILLITVSFAGVGLFAYRHAESQSDVRAREMNTVLSDQVAGAMRLWLNEQKLQAVTLAADGLVVACAKYPNNVALREELERKFRRQHSLKPYLTMINLMIYRSADDPPVRVVQQGEVRTVGNGRSLVDSISGRSVGMGGLEDFSYIRAVAEGSATYISEAKPNAIPGLPPVFMIAVPVRDDGGKLVGALGYGVKIDYFTNLFIADFSVGATGRMEILDDRGLYMGSAVPEKLLTDEYRSHGQTLLPHLTPQKTTAFRLKLQGKEYDFAASPVTMDVDMANHWWVLFHRSVEELDRKSAKYGLWLLLLCSLGALLSTGVAVAASRSAAKRLKAESERYTRTYVEGTPYGLLQLGPEGRVLNANPAACELFGYSYEEIRRLSLSALLPRFPFAPAPDLPSADGAEVQGRRKDGEDLVVVREARTLDDGTTLLFLKNNTVAAGHRKAVARLSENLAASLRKSEELRRRAEGADKAKNEFLAEMSHDIRTPLNSVSGLAHLLSLSRLDERQEDYVRKITDAAHALKEVIGDILDFAGLEAGKMTAERVPFHLPSLLEEIRAKFAREASAKGITVALRSAGDEPEYLEGDPTHLRRVLGNVLTNAVRFTERGGVALFCRRLGPAKHNGVVLEFRVQDTGIGIAGERLQDIFQPFSRAGVASTRQSGGVGLGLPLCRRLLELMGGEISLESTPGAGTTVVILCPFGVTDAASARSMLNDVGDVRERLRNRIFLLAEDNPLNRQIVVELLADVGAETVTAADGHEALACLAETPTRFDAVVMDLDMPGMDGYTAAEEIRRQPRFKNLPIVAMTAHSMAGERERCIAVGMNAHIAKPIDVDALYATLARVLQ